MTSLGIETPIDLRGVWHGQSHSIRLSLLGSSTPALQYFTVLARMSLLSVEAVHELLRHSDSGYQNQPYRRHRSDPEAQRCGSNEPPRPKATQDTRQSDMFAGSLGTNSLYGNCFFLWVVLVT